MINLTIWDKTSSLTLPNGVLNSAEEIFTKFPFTRTGVTVLEFLPNGTVGGIDDLEILKGVHNITEATVEGALAAIVEKRNAPPEPVPAPNEELNAKLDYLIMML